MFEWMMISISVFALACSGWTIVSATIQAHYKYEGAYTRDQLNWLDQ